MVMPVAYEVFNAIHHSDYTEDNHQCGRRQECE